MSRFISFTAGYESNCAGFNGVQQLLTALGLRAARLEDFCASLLYLPPQVISIMRVLTHETTNALSEVLSFSVTSHRVVGLLKPALLRKWLVSFILLSSYYSFCFKRTRTCMMYNYCINVTLGLPR